jgi:antitoxin MazE
MRVAKWGNSLAVRLPADLVKALKLHEGDDVEIVVYAPGIFAVHKKLDAAELLMRLRRFRGKLPVDFKFRRVDANGRD